MEKELLGNITWDDEWSGKMTLPNGEIAEFSIEVYEPGDAVIKAARNTLKFLITNETLIRHKIAVSMRELYNESWLDENTMTAEELAQSITLHSVQVWEDGGNLSYTTDDPDLFAGHWIQVLFDANGEIGKPEIEG